ncbi:MAG: CdaR family protein [Roseburia sp.]|nr:CdaR family protein [Ruminococcus sp.]MCM1156608.1 CdaR family protein [Roseburia sp.]MCM1243071.1 CdaR family protein [Roseburia sp.]
MKNRLTRNWGLKIGSFLFAAVLWLIVTNINDPIGTIRVYNVPVTIQNADLITNNGQVYEVLDHTGTLDVVTISAKRSIIDALDASNVIAVADMNDLTSLNTIPIKLSTNKYNDRLESISGNIDNVKLNIETEKTKTLQLRTETTGTVKEGYIVGDITAEQNLIAISGPESVISQVKRAVATVDVSGFTNNIGTDAEIRLYDEEDKIINASSIVKNISKVRVTVEILEVKTVDINWKVSGVPAGGYLATGEVTAGRNSVMIAGRSKTIADITTIEIPEGALDISGATENFETIVDLTNYLPDGVILAEEDFQGKVRVNVAIEPVSERVVHLPVNQIQVLNVPEGFTIETAEENLTYPITLVGLQTDIDALDLGTLRPSIDIAEYMEEEGLETIEEGIYAMGVDFQLENDAITVKDAVRIRLELTAVGTGE